MEKNDTKTSEINDFLCRRFELKEHKIYADTLCDTEERRKAFERQYAKAHRPLSTEELNEICIKDFRDLIGVATNGLREFVGNLRRTVNAIIDADEVEFGVLCAKQVKEDDEYAMEGIEALSDKARSGAFDWVPDGRRLVMEYEIASFPIHANLHYLNNWLRVKHREEWEALTQTSTSTTGAAAPIPEQWRTEKALKLLQKAVLAGLCEKLSDGRYKWLKEDTLFAYFAACTVLNLFGYSGTKEQIEWKKFKPVFPDEDLYKYASTYASKGDYLRLKDDCDFVPPLNFRTVDALFDGL